MSTEAQQLIRLARVFEERGAPVERVLSIVTVGGSSTLFLGVSALTRRLELLVPVAGETLQLVAPGVAPGVLPERGSVQVSVDGDRLRAAIVAIGAPPARDAVADVAPTEAGRQPWLEVVDGLVGLGGTIMNRTRFLTEPRGAISVSFDRRAADAEERFAGGLEAHAVRIGLTAAQRARWKASYPVAGAGLAFSVSTACGPDGPAAQLAARYGHSEWDRAIDVIKVLVDTTQAREAAATLGSLAGLLEAERLRGFELVIGPDELADVIVWLGPRLAS